jgi:arylsulfatase A-like enzyme
VDFIEAFLKKHRDEPVFVYYPMALPHGPFVPTPLSEEWEDPDLRLKSDRKYYADMVEYMDFLVGRILSMLDDLGLEERTLVLFYADNGTPRSITSRMDQRVVHGGKGLTAQTGIRVPLIAYWPGKVDPGTTDALVDASDFLPTLADLTGIEINDARHSDGISFEAILSGDTTHEREAVFFWYDPRPGWDKDPYTRKVFALDHQYKLFADGRIFDIRGEYPEEKELDPAALTADARTAKIKLEQIIEAYMQPPFSPAASDTPEAGPQ